MIMYVTKVFMTSVVLWVMGLLFVKGGRQEGSPFVAGLGTFLALIGGLGSFGGLLTIIWLL